MSEKETTFTSISGRENELANLLIGKLKTLVDASVENERQAKALKDILSSIIWEIESERLTSIRRILYTCEKAGLPLLPDWLVNQVKTEVGY